MKRLTYISALLFTLTASATLRAASDGFKTPGVPAFSRYQGILNRMPFGAPPPQSADPVNPIDAKSAAQEQRDQQLLARKINMSCVNITPAGVAAVGFTDLSMKPPVNYYLLVGDDANGWKVLDANYEEEWAQLENGGTSIFVKLGQGLMDAPPPVKPIIAKSPAFKRQKSAVKNDAAEPEEEVAVKERDPLLDEPKEIQTAYLQAIELAGGPPMPDIQLATIDPAKLAELEKERQEIYQLKKQGVKTQSYRDRLAQKYDEAEKSRQEEEASKRKDVEELARYIAQEEIKKRLEEERIREEEALLKEQQGL